MKHATWILAAVVPLLGGMRQAQADPLNPGDFASLGQLTLGPGVYTVNTDTLQLLGAGGLLFTGVSSGGSAVFDFDRITLDAGATLIGTGSHSLALLSRGDVTLNGSVSFAGSQGAMGQVGAQGHPGADGAPGAPGVAGSPGNPGRAGADARQVRFVRPIFETFRNQRIQVGAITEFSVSYPGAGLPGGRGGQGGPGGRGFDGGSGGQGGQGGAGSQGTRGGSVEIGALGNISVGGAIRADGGAGGNGGAGGAGGVGGHGGAGGPGGPGGAGGAGGAGGRGGVFQVGFHEEGRHLFGGGFSFGSVHNVTVANAPNGPQGARGATGPQGAAGHQGATGAMGLQGLGGNGDSAGSIFLHAHSVSLAGLLSDDGGLGGNGLLGGNGGNGGTIRIEYEDTGFFDDSAGRMDVSGGRGGNSGHNGALGSVIVETVASPVPEPSSLALLGTATITLAGYFGWRRRKLALA